MVRVLAALASISAALSVSACAVTVTDDTSTGDADATSGGTTAGDGETGGATGDGDGDGTSGDGDGTSGDGDGTSGDGDGTTGDGDGDGDGALVCGDEWVPKPNPAAPNLQQTWGAACSTDGECEALLGVGGVCVTDVLGVFGLPGGYCTKPCTLPDTSTTFIPDSAECDPAGGIDCVGAMGFFTVCAPPCTEHSECAREGYGCSQLPVIAGASDPTYCLMDPDSCCLDPATCGP